MKKITIILVLLILVSAITGCNQTPKLSDKFDMPQAPKQGGYEIQTDEFYCCILADGNQKYVCFESISGMGAEFYISATETIMLFTQNGQTSFYTESQQPSNFIYPNPMQRVLDDLQSLDFRCIRVDSDWEIGRAHV